MTGDQSEGPVTGTSQGDHSEKPRCCRRLQFDDEPAAEPGLEDNLRNGFQEELRSSRDAARLRWNFDFEREEPLAGNWAWEKVGEGETVPPVQSQNFDFEREEPLAGNWAWEKVGEGETVPPVQSQNFDFEREEPLAGNWDWEKMGEGETVPPVQSQEDGELPQEEEQEESGGGS